MWDGCMIDTQDLQIDIKGVYPMKKTLAAILAGAMALSLTACGGSSDSADSAAGEDGKITLSMLHFYTDEEAKTNLETQAYVNSMNTYIEEHPDINFDIQTMSHNDYPVKIQALSAADELPDVFIVKGSWVENFVNNEQLADLTEYKDTVEWADDFYDGVFDSCTIDGKIYGVPNQFPAPTSMVFYDSELWAQAGYSTFPETWEEVEEASAKFKEQGIETTVALGNKEQWNYESCWFSTLADRYTGTDWMNNILARDGSAKFTDEDFVSALKFTADLGASGILNPDYNSITGQQANDLFIQGKAASVITGNWDISYFLTNADESFTDRIKIAALPQPAGAEKGEKGSMSSSSGWFVAVNSKLEGEKLEAALDFAFSIAGPEFSKNNAELQGGLSPVKYEFDTSTLPQLRQDYIAIAAEVPPAPVYDVVLSTEIVDVLNAGLQGVLDGTVSPEDLAQQVQDEYELLQ